MRTIVLATAPTASPVAGRISQWPVRRVPDRPIISAHRSQACSGESGLLNAWPSTSNTESQPITSASASAA